MSFFEVRSNYKEFVSSGFHRVIFCNVSINLTAFIYRVEHFKSSLALTELKVKANPFLDTVGTLTQVHNGTSQKS